MQQEQRISTLFPCSNEELSSQVLDRMGIYDVPGELHDFVSFIGKTDVLGPGKIRWELFHVEPSKTPTIYKCSTETELVTERLALRNVLVGKRNPDAVALGLGISLNTNDAEVIKTLPTIVIIDRNLLDSKHSITNQVQHSIYAIGERTFVVVSEELIPEFKIKGTPKYEKEVVGLFIIKGKSTVWELQGKSRR